MCPLGLKVDTGGELAVFHDSRKCAGAATVSVVHPNFKAKKACSPGNTCAGSYEKKASDQVAGVYGVALTQALAGTLRFLLNILSLAHAPGRVGSQVQPRK